MSRLCRIRPGRAAIRGVTLVELLLVLALLVVIAGLTVPSLQGAWNAARLASGGDFVRAAWARARIDAMESGQPVAFLCRWQTGEFVTQAAHSVATPPGQMVSGIGESASQPPAIPSSTEPATPAESERQVLSGERLPSGVLFSSGEVAIGLGLPLAPDAISAGGWSSPIYFYPDGTATDAVLVLVDTNGKLLRVTLRGVTGVSRIAVDDDAEIGMP